MEFRIEKRGEIALIGLAKRVSCDKGANLSEIPAIWEDCFGKGYVEALTSAIPKSSTLGVMGVCINDFDNRNKTSTYLVGIESPTDAEARKALPPGCVQFKAPAGTWAVFASRGPLPGAIQDVWKRIYSEWFPTSGYEHADSPELEAYPAGERHAADYYCEVWLPVKKA
jgi:AraC family transcriptional regulator